MTTVTETVTEAVASPLPGTLTQPLAGAQVQIEWEGRWVPVCGTGELTPGRGVAAVLPDGRQVAVFLDRSGRTYAIGNRDPFTGAYVLSRGLLGSTGNDGRPFVASPLLKQRFDLVNGRCLDDEAESVPVYPTRRQ
jgi:nitrite reductase (NADH) small subunit